MLEGFEYAMPKWIPFQDREACRMAREIQKEDITRHPNPEFRIEVIEDVEFPFRLVTGMFARIKQAADEGRRLVLIVPQPEPLYRRVARLINEFRVDCRRLYTFNMDEYADQDGNIAPETWPNCFLHNVRKNFYALIDEDLRPPEHQINGPTGENFGSYGRMIADLGGADVCFGGIGWSGHLAFIEPGSAAFRSADPEEWKTIGPARGWTPFGHHRPRTPCEERRHGQLRPTQVCS